MCKTQDLHGPFPAKMPALHRRVAVTNASYCFLSIAGRSMVAFVGTREILFQRHDTIETRYLVYSDLSYVLIVKGPGARALRYVFDESYFLFMEGIDEQQSDCEEWLNLVFYEIRLVNP